MKTTNRFEWFSRSVPCYERSNGEAFPSTFGLTTDDAKDWTFSLEIRQNAELAGQPAYELVKQLLTARVLQARARLIPEAAVKLEFPLGRESAGILEGMLSKCDINLAEHRSEHVAAENSTITKQTPLERCIYRVLAIQEL